ncbi:phytanoyl-CoA dioxygenase family protein [Streptomyces sp. NPDC001493]
MRSSSGIDETESAGEAHSEPVEYGEAIEARKSFEELGYLVLPGFLPPALVDRLVPEVDRWMDEGLRARAIACSTGTAAGAHPPVLELELPAHGELLVHPPLMSLLADVMGGPFVHHHMHSQRQGAGDTGKPWHHDNEPNDRGDRSLVMVHALHYLGGLNEAMGSLAVLPGSHHEDVAKDYRAGLGTAEQPGEEVIDRLPRGSTVLINSAVFHARRPAPSPVAGQDRYFVDASYCRTGARWRPVKPYWRYMLARAEELGLGRGTWPELFSDRHFTEFQGVVGR